MIKHLRLSNTPNMLKLLNGLNLKDYSMYGNSIYLNVSDLEFQYNQINGDKVKELYKNEFNELLNKIEYEQ